MKINNLIKKGDIFILINRFNCKVVQYLYMCPELGLPVFRRVLVKKKSDLMGACYGNKCKYLSECEKQPIEYWFEDDIIDYLKTKRLVKFNKLNAILYLDNKTRKKVYKYLKQSQI